MIDVKLNFLYRRLVISMDSMFCADDVVDEVFRRFGIKIFRSTKYDVLTDYYGPHLRGLPPKHRDKIFLHVPVLWEYQYGQRGLFYWRDILKIIPKRERCNICRSPPTRWDETAHGKRRNDTNYHWNCLGDLSNKFREEIYQANLREREIQENRRQLNLTRMAIVEAKKQRKEEIQWLNQAKQTRKQITSYLRKRRNPNL